MAEKNQKTSSNQSTKFHQLQQMFGNNGNHHVVNHSIITSELNREPPNSPSKIITTGDAFHTENEVSFILILFLFLFLWNLLFLKNKILIYVSSYAKHTISNRKNSDKPRSNWHFTNAKYVTWNWWSRISRITN